MTEFEKTNFCDYPASKALKEIGFDEPCIGFFDIPNNEFWIYTQQPRSFNTDNNFLVSKNHCGRPTFLDARAFFRKHGIDVEVLWIIRSPRDEDETEFRGNVLSAQSDGECNLEYSDCFNTEPEAWNACIIKACEIIKERKQ